MITWLKNGKELENKRAHEPKNVPISLYRKFEFHPDQDTPMKEGDLLKSIDNKTKREHPLMMSHVFGPFLTYLPCPTL